MHETRPPDPSVRAARDLLGVAADADPPQITRAYRRHARHLHPDISLEADATERFWALQAAYHLALEAACEAAPHAALEAASDAARPDTSSATTSAAAAPTTIEHRDPTVALGTSPTLGIPATRNGVRRHVAWMVAGPVHVQPAHHAVPGAESPTTPGAP